MATSDVKAPKPPIAPRKPSLGVPAEPTLAPKVAAPSPPQIQTDYRGAKAVGTNLTGVSRVDNSKVVPARQVTICLTGAIDQTTEANVDFGKMCDLLEERGTGLIKDGQYSSFDTFPRTWAPDAIVQKVLNAMDANRDGIVNGQDGKLELNILGFSWGGVNASRLATKVLDRVESGDYLTVHLGLVDAFQPFVSKVRIDARVGTAVNLMHSISPSRDCSEGVPLGPYLGKQIECAPGQDCSQFDASGPPDQGSLWKATTKVDHCDMPREAELYLSNLVLFGYLMGPENQNRLPPSVPVKRYIVP